MTMRFGVAGLACLLLVQACSPSGPSPTQQAADFSTTANMRIALVGTDPAFVGPGCTDRPQNNVAKAYVDHLNQRLEKPVQLCGYPDQGAVASALKAGQVDMAVLDRTGFVAVKDEARAILTPRFDPTVGRVLGVALALKGSDIDGVEKMKGQRPIFIGADAPSRAILLQGLADHDVDIGSFGPEVMANEMTGLKTLQDGGGDMLIVTAGARQRMCRAANPKGGKCPDLVEFWRGRPTAQMAFVVANRLSQADRYQLIGIHLPMHAQNPAAFGFIAKLAPGAVMLDPTEPSALLKGTR